MSSSAPQSADGKWVKTRDSADCRGSAPASGPREARASRLGFLLWEPIATGRSILFRPQHLSGFQVDKVRLRARQACDRLIRGVVIGHIVSGPALHDLAALSFERPGG